MKTFLIIFIIAVISLGVYAGIKSKGKMCDYKQCSDSVDINKAIESGGLNYTPYEGSYAQTHGYK